MKKDNSILSQEERDVLILAALRPGGEHLSNDEISEQLKISVNRVKTLIHQACTKLGASNRNQAVHYAVRLGEISLAEIIPLDEIAELFGSLNPDMLKEIAHFLRQKLDLENSEEENKQLIIKNKSKERILTDGERDVLIRVGRGLTNEEIADSLCVSPNTVRTYLYRASKKLGAQRRADAVIMAVKLGEIGVHEMYTPLVLIQLLLMLGAEALDEIAQLLDSKNRMGTDRKVH